MTLTVTLDLLQGQICCQAGDHNSLNLLVYFIFERDMSVRLIHSTGASFSNDMVITPFFT